jgi:hypothetical protein
MPYTREGVLECIQINDKSTDERVNHGPTRELTDQQEPLIVRSLLAFHHSELRFRRV